MYNPTKIVLSPSTTDGKYSRTWGILLNTRRSFASSSLPKQHWLLSLPAVDVATQSSSALCRPTPPTWPILYTILPCHPLPAPPPSSDYLRIVPGQRAVPPTSKPSQKALECMKLRGARPCLPHSFGRHTTSFPETLLLHWPTDGQCSHRASSSSIQTQIATISPSPSMQRLTESQSIPFTFWRWGHYPTSCGSNTVTEKEFTQRTLSSSSRPWRPTPPLGGQTTSLCVHPRHSVPRTSSASPQSSFARHPMDSTLSDSFPSLAFGPMGSSVPDLHRWVLVHAVLCDGSKVPS